jgi:knotted carbamoyltransferase YgeW
MNLSKLETLSFAKSYGEDFLLTWEKSNDELRAVFEVADALRDLRESGLSARIFDSGLAVSLFRDNSTRTRFSYASACNLLGLATQDLDEGKSQMAHGETIRETTAMISFMAEAIGIRDDMFIGKGNAFMRSVSEAASAAFAEGVLARRPAGINLQCDLDHPTQIMADMAHLIRHFGGIENLRGKKVAMTWAYSPSYGKPLSVPQGVCGLMTRFGMDVALAHPPGYEIMPEVEELAMINAAESGGKFSKTSSMREAFEGADIVYPQSWAPFKAMQMRSSLSGQGDSPGIRALERELLSQNGLHRSWECDSQMMSLTSNGDALYLHCLPADISGVSCERGEVSAEVFEKSRVSLDRQASWKPYVIAAMIFLSKVKDPVKGLNLLASRGNARALLD